jgi:phosphatidylserine synthase
MEVAATSDTIGAKLDEIAPWVSYTVSPFLLFNSRMA